MSNTNNQSKIKLLHIAFVGGGVDIAIRLINTNIDPDKFNIHVIREEEHKTYYNKNEESITSSIISVRRNIGFTDISRAIELYRKVKKIKPDIVHVHSAKAGILGRLVTFFLGIKTFYTPHAFSYLSASSNIKRKVFLSFERLSRLFFTKVKIIACSPSEKNRAIQEVGFSPNKVLLFNNSIPEISIKDSNSNSYIKTKKRYICTIGRPSFQKNLAVMIHVLTEMHSRGFKEHLIILGVGQYAPDIEVIKALIKENKLENYVTLVPWISRDEALSIVNNAEIYISTARYEGLPLSVIEAMALGIPVVASNVDGNKDLITEGVHGFLIDNFNITEFADRIIKLLTDKEMSILFSKNLINEYKKNYTSSKNIGKLEKIYLNNKTRR